MAANKQKQDRAATLAAIRKYADAADEFVETPAGVFQISKLPVSWSFRDREGEDENAGAWAALRGSVVAPDLSNVSDDEFNEWPLDFMEPLLSAVNKLNGFGDEDDGSASAAADTFPGDS